MAEEPVRESDDEWGRELAPEPHAVRRKDPR
jgi:hypothetical protein